MASNEHSNEILVKERVRDVTKTHRYQQGSCAIEIGRFTYYVDGMSVQARGQVNSFTIGSFCSIARGLKVIIGGNHRMDWLSTFPFGHIFEKELSSVKMSGHPGSGSDVVIGNDVWIGTEVTIMSGVKVGDGAVIAANSHVVKDVLPYEVVGGNPAKHIRFRFPEETIKQLLELKWWDLSVEAIRQIVPSLNSELSDDLIKNLLNLKSELLRQKKP